MKISRKILALFLAFALAAGMTPLTLAADSTYSDVTANHWAGDVIAKWSGGGYGVLEGDGSGRFLPENEITLAELAALLSKTFGYTERVPVEVTPSWADEYVEKAVAAGIIGKAAEIDATAVVTREQAVKYIAIAYNVAPVSGETGFADNSAIGAEYKPYVNSFQKLGYVAGKPGNIFDPAASYTRAEAMQLIENTTSEIADKSVTGQSYSRSLIVRKSGVTVSDTVIGGDLIIGQGVGDGEVTLDNVKLDGSLIAYGGGANSVTIKGGTIPNTVANKPYGETLHLSGAFGTVTVTNGTDVMLTGKADKLVILGNSDVTLNGAEVRIVEVTGENVKLALNGGGTVDNAVVGAGKVVISGSGKVTNVSVTAVAKSGVEVLVPAKVTVDSGAGAVKTRNGMIRPGKTGDAVSAASSSGGGGYTPGKSGEADPGYSTDAEGNITVYKAGATLSGVNIPGGTVTISSAVGDGEVTLTNVVADKLIANGGGMNSIRITGASRFATAVLNKTDGEPVNLKIEGTVTVTKVEVKPNSKAILTGKAVTLEVEADADIQLAREAVVENIVVEGDRVTLTVTNGATVSTITVNADNTVIVTTQDLEGKVVDNSDGGVVQLDPGGGAAGGSGAVVVAPKTERVVSYDELKAAIAAALDGTGLSHISVIESFTIEEDFTIPKGVTILIDNATLYLGNYNTPVALTVDGKLEIGKGYSESIYSDGYVSAYGIVTVNGTVTVSGGSMSLFQHYQSVNSVLPELVINGALTGQKNDYAYWWYGNGISFPYGTKISGTGDLNGLFTTGTEPDFIGDSPESFRYYHWDRGQQKWVVSQTHAGNFDQLKRAAAYINEIYAQDGYYWDYWSTSIYIQGEFAVEEDLYLPPNSSLILYTYSQWDSTEGSTVYTSTKLTIPSGQTLTTAGQIYISDDNNGDNSKHPELVVNGVVRGATYTRKSWSDQYNSETGQYERVEYDYENTGGWISHGYWYSNWDYDLYEHRVGTVSGTGSAALGLNDDGETYTVAQWRWDGEKWADSYVYASTAEGLSTALASEDTYSVTITGNITLAASSGARELNIPHTKKLTVPENVTLTVGRATDDQSYETGYFYIYGTLEVNGTLQGVAVNYGGHYGGYAHMYLGRSWRATWNEETQKYDREYRAGQITGSGVPSEITAKQYDVINWQWFVDSATGVGTWVPVDVVASDANELLKAVNDTVTQIYLTGDQPYDNDGQELYGKTTNLATVDDLTIAKNQNLQIGAYWDNDNISLTVKNLTIDGDVGTQNWWWGGYYGWGWYQTWWWNTYNYDSNYSLDWDTWAALANWYSPYWRWLWLQPYYSEYGNKLIITDSLTINDGGQLWGGNGLMIEIKEGATVKQTYNGVEVEWFEPGHSYIYVGNADAGAWLEIPKTEPEGAEPESAILESAVPEVTEPEVTEPENPGTEDIGDVGAGIEVIAAVNTETEETEETESEDPESEDTEPEAE
ncbi:MAG: S-layer homology domain-containing protein [Oscillospiraceae bacterium]|jgi:hypothetical protein|nr:S-layer homology domain-containing protein [Oscillospiraceae bacterium]